MKGKHVIVLAGLVALIGCQGGAADLPAKEDQALRGKIDQGLSPAEIEKAFGKDYMKNNAGGGAPSAPPKTKGPG